MTAAATLDRTGLPLAQVTTIARSDGTHEISNVRIQNDGIAYLVPGNTYRLQYPGGAWRIAGGHLDPTHDYRLLSPAADDAITSLPVAEEQSRGVMLNTAVVYLLVPTHDGWQLHSL